jgi:hypothetical protein
MKKLFLWFAIVAVFLKRDALAQETENTRPNIGNFLNSQYRF